MLQYFPSLLPAEQETDMHSEIKILLRYFYSEQTLVSIPSIFVEPTSETA